MLHAGAFLAVAKREVGANMTVARGGSIAASQAGRMATCSIIYACSSVAMCRTF